MSGLNDEVLSDIVRRAQCQRCKGMGFKMARVEGKDEKIECQECKGNGIKLGLCRKLAAESNGRS